MEGTGNILITVLREVVETALEYPEKSPGELAFHILDDYSRYIIAWELCRNVREKPHHPQTQGKIEMYHRSMKNVIFLENYYSPEELETEIASFVDYYKNHRYHESMNNLTPADVFFGRGKEILRKREITKQRTMVQRRLENNLLNAVLK